MTDSTDDALRETVLETLEALGGEDIPHCVLRNFEFLDGGSIDGDVDVLARRRDRDKVRQVLRSAGFYPADGDTTQQTVFVKFVPRARQLLVIDIYWDAPTYNGVPLLDGERTLTNRTLFQGVPIPSDEDYFVELIFHPALNKNRYRAHYQEELDRLRTIVDQACVREHARVVFGEHGVTAVERTLDGDYEAVIGMKPQLVAASLRKSPELAPSLIWNLLVRREVLKRIRRVKNRASPLTRKPVIALLGPDGAGKTSVATELEGILEENGFDPERRELGTYNSETFLMRIGKRVDSFVEGKSTGGAASDGANDRSLGRRGSPGRAAVHLADIGLRQIAAEVSNGSVIVADRYAHDIAIYDRLGPLDRLLSLFARTPFYPIVLAGDPEALASRSEYDEDSIRKMQTRLKRFDFPRVDATQDLDDVVDCVLETVFTDGQLLRASGYRLE